MRHFKLVSVTSLLCCTLAYSSANFADDVYCDAKLHLTTRNQVYQFIHWLNAVGSYEKISERDIADYFAPSFKYIVNGKIGAINATQLHKRYVLSQQQYQLAYIQFPLTDILIDCNKAALQYTVTYVDKRGVHRTSHNTAIVKYNDHGKIDVFSQSYDIGTPLTA